ncbi:hypothetical protein [Escherichia coli]|uniref:hypothetical protein n=1 Tax=Escherichia coli TaxID=562 RepID=UPI001A979B99|nr:hypothetical protein [Escherichia coli]
MGSCAAPSAKGDDKFITTDYLQQCRRNRTCHYESLVETGQIARRDNMEGNASVDFDIDALFG